ncbi:hypothetical protein ACOBV9_18340 (plasmid) [Pseudoalteromonas espejiana]
MESKKQLNISHSSDKNKDGEAFEFVVMSFQVMYYKMPYMHFYIKNIDYSVWWTHGSYIKPMMLDASGFTASKSGCSYVR